MTTAINDTIERQVISGTGPYPFTFRIFNDTDLTVAALSTDTPPAVVPLTLDTHYTVSGVNAASGGTVTLDSTIASTYAGYTLDIRSNTPQDMPTNFRNTSRWLPESGQDAFDYLSRQVQDIERRLGLTVRFPDNMTTRGEMTSIQEWLSSYLAIGPTGDLEAATLTSSGALTRSIVGAILYPSSVSEGVTVVNAYKEYGNILRYGTNTTPGTTDMSAAAQAAVNSGFKVTADAGTILRFNSTVTYTGKVTIDLTGATIYSDVETFKITDGSGSRVKLGKLYPVTTPYTILRTPGSWTNVAGDVTQKFTGYMPSSLDTDIWGSLSAGIQNQLNQIHPGIYFNVSSSAGGTDVQIEIAEARCTHVILEGYTHSAVINSDIGGNGYRYAAVVFINGVPVSVASASLGFTLPRGVGNKLQGCNLRYATLCGVTWFGQDEFSAFGNTSCFHGESGFKTYGYDTVAGPSATDDCQSFGGTVYGNTAHSNYYDGFDFNSVYGVVPVADTYIGTSLVANRSFDNRHTGYVASGSGFSIVANQALRNGTHGVWMIGWDSLVSSNHARDNMQTGTSLVAQPFDVFAQGDDLVVVNNQISNASAPATYNFFQSGFIGAAPTSGHEGLSFGNYCDAGVAKLYVHPAIPAYQGNTVTRALSASAPRTVTGTTDSATAIDAAIIFNASGTCTETLPSASDNPGRILKLRTIAAQTVVSATSNVIPLAGGAAGTAILAATAGKWAELRSDGTNWQIMAAN